MGVRRTVAIPPSSGGPSPPAHPRLVAEELLLYDKDGQSLLDDHALRILIALHQETLTAQEISQRYKIPIAPCYRRIRRLVSIGLISEAGYVTEGRRRPAHLYKSEVDRFTITYGSGEMTLHLMLRNGVAATAVVHLRDDVVTRQTTGPVPPDNGQHPTA